MSRDNLLWAEERIANELLVKLGIRVSPRTFRWRSTLASVLVLGAVVVLLRGSLINGEFVSTYPDAWRYSVFSVTSDRTRNR